jgi:hypothetical protein
VTIALCGVRFANSGFVTRLSLLAAGPSVIITMWIGGWRADPSNPAVGRLRNTYDTWDDVEAHKIDVSITLMTIFGADCF